VLIGCIALPAASASPEARRLIAFVDDGDIYVVSSDGTGRRPLTEGPARDRDIAWSPDGSRLAFVREIRVGVDRGDWVTRPVIYIIGVDGRGLRRLSPRRVLFDEGPAWSPDGRQIAFSRNTRSDGLDDIWLMRSDGTRQHRLTRHRRLDRSPTWSPDGQRIAFARTWPNQSQVFIMDADGRNEHAATRPGISGSYSTWSPRGDLIAFIGTNGSLYVVQSDRRGIPGRTRGALWPPWQPPQWSSTGKEIAFERGYVPSYIYIVRADGTGVRRLTQGTEAHWSPDDRSIAFAGKGGIYVIDSAGGRPRLVTEGGSPAWQP
jgi:TolB protein